MKLIDVLNETWVGGRKNLFGKYFEIFKNPTSKEWREIGGFPRIIADNKKKVIYAFNNQLLHFYAKEELGLSTKELNTNFLEGQVKIKNNIQLIEINFFESYEPNEIEGHKNLEKFSKEFLKIDWNWLSTKYDIDIKSYFNRRVSLFK